MFLVYSMHCVGFHWYENQTFYTYAELEQSDFGFETCLGLERGGVFQYYRFGCDDHLVDEVLIVTRIQ